MFEVDQKTASFEVRRLEVSDVEDYRTIRLAALAGAPDSFGSVYEVERDRPLARRLQPLSNMRGTLLNS